LAQDIMTLNKSARYKVFYYVYIYVSN